MDLKVSKNSNRTIFQGIQNILPNKNPLKCIGSSIVF